MEFFFSLSLSVSLFLSRITLLLLLFAVTIFCEFLRFGKNRKIKYPQKFLPTYQAPWCIQSQTAWWFFILDHAWSFSFVRFCLFFSSFRCHHDLEKVTFLMISMIVRVSRVNFELCSQIYLTTGVRYRCTMWNAATRGQRCIYIATAFVLTQPHLLKPTDFKVELFTFGCAKSQNLARLHEIAKISTRKIIPLPKSQNFVLANNSNNKVYLRVGIGVGHWAQQIVKKQPMKVDPNNSPNRFSSWIRVRVRVWAGAFQLGYG